MWSRLPGLPPRPARAPPRPSSRRVPRAEARASRRQAAPPPASPAELKTFLTHMAAGLFGGLVGVVALAFAWGGLPGGGKKAAAPDLSGLEQRLAKLEAEPAHRRWREPESAWRAAGRARGAGPANAARPDRFERPRGLPRTVAEDPGRHRRQGRLRPRRGRAQHGGGRGRAAAASQARRGARRCRDRR